MFHKLDSMKKIVLIIALMSVLAFNEVQAQNPQYPLGLNIKALFMDYQSQNGGDISNFNAYHSGFEISAQKSINENINIVVPFKFGVVRSHDATDFEFIHKTIYGLDAQVQYQFYNPDAQIKPYVLAGIGAVTETEGTFNMQIPFGFGFHFKMTDNAYINWQSEYRYALEDDRNNLHHGIGFTYLFGAPKPLPEKVMEDTEELQDSDGDGIEDDIDLCPQIFGPKELKGCPDNDGDGVPDYRDDCPSVEGLAIFKGCPDTDKDGVSDNDDECPNVPGTQANIGCPEDDRDGDGIKDDEDICPDEKGIATNNGCPEDQKPAIEDADGDGIADDQDKCPNIKGTASADGCPDADGDGISDFDDKCPSNPGIKLMNGCPDSDNDGIDDSRDKCPDTPGTVAANGCPGISEADLTILETAMRAVSFDTGKASLKQSSYPILNQIAAIMERYPNYNLVIEGHTDNVGPASNNQVLSERRAKACFDYLITKGTNSDRMSYAGYGESTPISDNNSLSGRTLNRRVEFNLKPR